MKRWVLLGHVEVLVWLDPTVAACALLALPVLAAEPPPLDRLVLEHLVEAMALYPGEYTF